MAESISEGTLKSWLKQPGDFVNADEDGGRLKDWCLDVRALLATDLVRLTRPPKKSEPMLRSGILHSRRSPVQRVDAPNVSSNSHERYQRRARCSSPCAIGQRKICVNFQVRKLWRSLSRQNWDPGRQVYVHIHITITQSRSHSQNESRRVTPICESS